MPRRLPIKLQKQIITKKFLKLNPREEPDDLNWDCMDNLCELDENIENMAKANPQFVWEEPETTLRRKKQEQAYNNDTPLEDENFIKKKWSVNKVEGGDEFSTTSEIKLYKQGKYTYAKIQVIAPEELNGLTAKITVYKRKIKYDEKDSVLEEQKEYFFENIYDSES